MLGDGLDGVDTPIMTTRAPAVLTNKGVTLLIGSAVDAPE